MRTLIQKQVAAPRLLVFSVRPDFVVGGAALRHDVIEARLPIFVEEAENFNQSLRELLKVCSLQFRTFDVTRMKLLGLAFEDKIADGDSHCLQLRLTITGFFVLLL